MIMRLLLYITIYYICCVLACKRPCIYQLKLVITVTVFI